MTVKEFIDKVFLNEYKELIDLGFHYISFALMGLGIEFLGACFDSHSFAQRGQSQARFTRAIRDLFPTKYHAQVVDLYRDLRSGLTHQFRPGFRYVLTHRAESAREGTHHLGPYGTQIVLVAEDLYEDFQRACNKVISDIDGGILTDPKLARRFLTITVPAITSRSPDTTEKIRRRAYEIYESRGRQDGHDLDDWLKAEGEIIAGGP